MSAATTQLPRAAPVPDALQLLGEGSGRDDDHFDNEGRADGGTAADTTVEPSDASRSRCRTARSLTSRPRRTKRAAPANRSFAHRPRKSASSRLEARRIRTTRSTTRSSSSFRPRRPSRTRTRTTWTRTTTATTKRRSSNPSERRRTAPGAAPKQLPPQPVTLKKAPTTQPSRPSRSGRRR